jgi:transcriptional regulator with AAA-type ATPase domain
MTPSFLRIVRYLEAIALSPQPVLITGETGTGKELVARALHRLSARPGELVAVNVAGLDDTMFSDTLFGHTRGAFTGAERPRDGVITSTAEGTLFLDDIGDLSMASQVKLLRLLQDGTFYPLGADRPRQAAPASCAPPIATSHRVSAQAHFARTCITGSAPTIYICHRCVPVLATCPSWCIISWTRLLAYLAR